MDYLDYVYGDLEMSRSHFIRKTFKENLKEYEQIKERENVALFAVYIFRGFKKNVAR